MGGVVWDCGGGDGATDGWAMACGGERKIAQAKANLSRIRQRGIFTPTSREDGPRLFTVGPWGSVRKSMLTGKGGEFLPGRDGNVKNVWRNAPGGAELAESDASPKLGGEVLTAREAGLGENDA